MDCVHNPFTTEFETMLGCLRHKDLVQLQGWCCEDTELALEYTPQKLQFDESPVMEAKIEYHFGGCFHSDLSE